MCNDICSVWKNKNYISFCIIYKLSVDLSFLFGCNLFSSQYISICINLVQKVQKYLFL